MKIVASFFSRNTKHVWLYVSFLVPRKMSTLDTLKFDNLALQKLPLDPIDRNYVRTVNGSCFSRVLPTPVQEPKLLCFSRSALELLDLNEDEVEKTDFVKYFSGNKLFPGSEPAAHCYCGHQFGHFSGQLGDGAAMYLGEVLNSRGERWELQLKGAGLTPYSRTADGRKVLRSSIREFLCSEAMHFLGIPTTRAGTCVTSETKVVRDVMYDGNPREEDCTVVSRIAPTFIRFGSFEIFKTLDPETGRVGPSVGRKDILLTLLDYVIETFYPEVHSGDFETPLGKYAAFFREVVLRTARLVAQWQCVGFCHGVLNTDNMSVVGLTLDYGPFGFLDMYDPNHVCNASDEGGRYSFSNQPGVCLWNLRKFAEALQPALSLDESLPLLALYEQEFQKAFLGEMRAKLGLIATEYPDEDNHLVEELLETMDSTGADYTNTFLCLTDADDLSGTAIVDQLVNSCYPLEAMVKAHKPKVNDAMLRAYRELAERFPDLEARFGRAGQSVRRVVDQDDKTRTLQKMTPEGKVEKDRQLWSDWLSKYRTRIERDSSTFGSDYAEQRKSAMLRSNPRLVLRNHIAQEAIEKAEDGDYSAVQRLVKALEKPYDRPEGRIDTCRDGAADLIPDWAFSLQVS